MGEAKRRRELGLPPRTHRCPVTTCRSRRLKTFPPDSWLSKRMAKAWGSAATTHELCLACKAVWEALPEGWHDDAVERARTMGPCDNCAYRATSAETRDLAQRMWLHGLAEAKEHEGLGSWPTGHFCCHKGIPIKMMDDGPEYDFAAAGIEPCWQSCAGWLRLLWAKKGAEK